MPSLEKCLIYIDWIIWYCTAWTVCIFWRLIPCQFLPLQMFSPILRVILLFCLEFPLLCISFKGSLGPSCLFIYLFLITLGSLSKFFIFQFSHLVISNSLWPHGLQHASLPCLSPTPELTQTHVHRVSFAIQPSHPLISPSPAAFNLSQHQGLFRWVSSLHHVANVLEFQLWHQSFQWIFRTDFL